MIKEDLQKKEAMSMEFAACVPFNLIFFFPISFMLSVGMFIFPETTRWYHILTTFIGFPLLATSIGVFIHGIKLLLRS